MAISATEGLLKEIQSGDIEEVYVHVSEKAIEWAAAGFINESNHLLETLWSYGLKHSENLWLPDQGLQILWQISGKSPSNIPFHLIDNKQIEVENWNCIFYPIWSGSVINGLANKPIQNLSGSELLIKAINAVYQVSENTSTVLNALERYINSEDAIGHSYYHAATAGSLLAARSSLTNEAEKFIKLWGVGYLKYGHNYTISSLMRDRATATFLLNKILSPILGLTKEACQKEIEAISAKLSERMLNGRTLIYGNLSWHDLLKKISITAIEQRTNSFSNKIVTNQWLGKEGADVAEIKKAEERLNVLFPQEYKDFLLVSNGFESISNIDPMLIPVSEVDFLKNLDIDLIEIYAGNITGNDPFAKLFSACIVVGGYNEEQQLLLVPLENNEWECWFFATWFPGRNGSVN